MMKRVRKVQVNRTSLQRLLDERGWKQKQLADDTGLSEPTVSRLITGSRSSASITTLSVVANRYNIPLQELILDDELPGESQETTAVLPPKQQIEQFFAERPAIAAGFAKIVSQEPEYIAAVLAVFIHAQETRNKERWDTST